MKKTIFSSTLIVLGISSTVSNAAISLVDSFVSTDATSASSYTVDGSGLSLTGASKVVITTGVEEDSNGAGLQFSGITFGGVGLTQVITAAGGQGRASVWYLDLAGKTITAPLNFVLTVAGGGFQEGLGFSAFSLSGTVDGVSASGIGNSFTLTTPTDGEFVVASYARNGGVDTTFSSNLTRLYNYQEGNFTAASASALLGSAGDYLLTSTSTNGSGTMVAASFEAIPEPSSLGLAGLGCLGLLVRRKR